MKKSILRIILVPSVITLAVTLLRLTGELQVWSLAKRCHLLCVCAAAE